MKRNITFKSFILAATIALAFAGCASTPAPNTTDDASVSAVDFEEVEEESTEVTVLELYDNCPETTFALEAEVALKATISNYNGITTFTYTGTIRASKISGIKDYYFYCDSIRASIEKGSQQQCTLTFNTSADNDGMELDLSSESAIVESLKSMKDAGLSTIYAFYN